MADVEVAWAAPTGAAFRAGFARMQQRAGALEVKAATLSPTSALWEFGNHGRTDERGMLSLEVESLPIHAAVMTATGLGNAAFTERTDEPWTLTHNAAPVLDVTADGPESDVRIPVVLEWLLADGTRRGLYLGRVDRPGRFLRSDLSLVRQAFAARQSGATVRGVSLAIAGATVFQDFRDEHQVAASLTTSAPLRAVAVRLVDCQGQPIEQARGSLLFEGPQTAAFACSLAGGRADLPCAAVASEVALRFEIAGLVPFTASATIPDAADLTIPSSAHAVVTGRLEAEDAQPGALLQIAWDSSPPLETAIQDGGSFRAVVPLTASDLELSTGSARTRLDLPALSASRVNDLGRVRLLAKDHLRLRIVSSQGEDLTSSAELRAAIGRREVDAQRNQDGLFEIASARGEEVRLLASAPGFTRVRHTARIEGQVEEVRLAPAVRVACQVQVPTGFAEHLRVWLRTEDGTLLDPDTSTPETSTLRNTWEHAPTGELRLLLCAADPPHVVTVRALRIDAAQPQAIEWNCQDLALQLTALRFQPPERTTGLLLVAPSPDQSLPWASQIPADGVLLLARGRTYLLYGPHCMATTLDSESGPVVELAEARSVTAAGDALTWSLVPEQPLMEHGRAVRLARPGEAYRHTPSARLGELVGLDAHRVYEDCGHEVQVVGGTARPPTIRGPGDTSSPLLEARRR